MGKMTISAEEAKAMAKMTKEEWQKLQEGMDVKYPKPAYMANPRPAGERGAYRDETYALVTRWHADTQLSYRPHAKAPGSKSHVRYEWYMKATTVGEALKLGSYPIDWCYDYEHGFIQVAPDADIRDEPIDMSKVEDESTLTDVDVAIYRWYRRELATQLGLNYKDLGVALGSGETTLMRAHRLVAQREARKRLEAARSEGRRITNEEVNRTLHEWAFARNTTRQNVLPNGQNWVWSDTLGLLRDRTGDIHLTPATKSYPEVVELLTKWLKDRLPAEAAKKFVFTSLNLNCNYAARIHRDGNNFGPSMIAAFGDFSGGELNYWPEDDKGLELEDLPADKSVSLKLGSGLALFNGNSAHSVNDFEGSRYSVVYFTLGCHAKCPPDTRDELIKMGVPFPAKDEEPRNLLRGPRGYGDSAKRKPATPQAQSELPAVRYWSYEELESQEFVPEPYTPMKELTSGAALKEELEERGRKRKERAAERKQKQEEKAKAKESGAEQEKKPKRLIVPARAPKKTAATAGAKKKLGSAIKGVKKSFLKAKISSAKGPVAKTSPPVNGSAVKVPCGKAKVSAAKGQAAKDATVAKKAASGKGGISSAKGQAAKGAPPQAAKAAKKSIAKTPKVAAGSGELPSEDAILVRGEKVSNTEYIANRVNKLAGKRVGQLLGKFVYVNASGIEKTYGTADLRYDLQRGLVAVKKK
eukprot:gnl/TRDRNA2_/TRDRNA2_179232_c0_seq1.p1 gnl/TRDRNA2_/TRDRNA2_179232_c0~~gnl/TRDRNA2_/TRDRNA2_179232_c0_seq1.p1  ORF type:complete len:698 (-),score=165.19 gnl/TRDRNA2_/TRDRNA2_179232_c0_seq1:183-2276(-)